MTPGDHEVTLAALAVSSALITVIILLVKTYGQAKAANTAVNNVGPGEHSLWDQVANIRDDVAELVEAQRDFTKRGWQTLPDDIATAARLTEKIRYLENGHERNIDDHERIIATLKELKATLREHDLWERDQKYER